MDAKLAEELYQQKNEGSSREEFNFMADYRYARHGGKAPEQAFALAREMEIKFAPKPKAQKELDAEVEALRRGEELFRCSVGSEYLYLGK